VIDERAIAQRWGLVSPELDERRRRVWAAAEACSHEHGGIAAVARATGLSRRTIERGVRELEGDQRLGVERVRKPGAGRPSLTASDPTLLRDLEKLLQPATRGDPERPLLWTSKSAGKLAQGLREMGHELVDRSVLRLLARLGYTMQANQKTREGADHPDRDAQFQYINDRAARALQAGEPVISVDTKKKELVGSFKAVGREWAPSGQPVQVNTHDFPSHALGKAIPYGVYDLRLDEGYVGVGISRDTAQFAAGTIAAWWEHLGAERYPHARSLTITADAGGSNGYRTRLWKTELQKLADQTGLRLIVCHFPPGTSKWNKVEHRLFSFISHTWRGKPLESYQVIISLITATTTSTGLKVYARLDETDYPKGIKVTNAQMDALNLHRHDFHGDWNYTITPTDIKS
jgi:Rhodopirellula transposase DDE domain